MAQAAWTEKGRAGAYLEAVQDGRLAGAIQPDDQNAIFSLSPEARKHARQNGP